jgi:hypothetical protein
MIQLQDMSLEAKQEAVFNTFRRTFDYDLALRTWDVSQEERIAMETNQLHMMRLKKVEEDAKAQIIDSLLTLSKKGKTDNIKLSATVELGRVIYRERFVPKEEKTNDSPVTVQVYMPDNGRDKEVK